MERPLLRNILIRCVMERPTAPAKKARTGLEDQQQVHCEEERTEVCTNTTGLKAGDRDLREGLTDPTNVIHKDGNPRLKRLSLSLKKIRPKVSLSTAAGSEDRPCKVHTVVEDEVGKDIGGNVSSNCRGGSYCDAANESILGRCALSELSGNGQEQEDAPGPLERRGSKEELSAEYSIRSVNVELKVCTPSSETVGEGSVHWSNRKDTLPLSVEAGPTVGGARSSEAYYSANFKSAINTVLTSSPERHVISGEAVEVVDRFMTLPGQV